MRSYAHARSGQSLTTVPLREPILHASSLIDIVKMAPFVLSAVSRILGRKGFIERIHTGVYTRGKESIGKAEFLVPTVS